MTDHTITTALTDDQREAIEYAADVIEENAGAVTRRCRALRALLAAPRAASVPADRRKAFEASMTNLATLDGSEPSFVRNGDDTYVQREMQSAWCGFDAACNLLDAAAAAPVAAWHGTNREAIQQAAIEHGFVYWRAPDAHGVEGTIQQATEFLQYLLAVEVEIKPSSTVAEPALMAAAYSDPFTTDVPQCCEDPENCPEPCIAQSVATDAPHAWAPSRIWLQRGQGDDGSHTWHSDSIGDDGQEAEYVRVDVHAVATDGAEKAMPLVSEPFFPPRIRPDQSERAVIDMLIALARATLLALDDSEEMTGDDGRQHVIDSANFDAVSNALDVLDELPDDKPGYTLGAAGKAEWALRNLGTAQAVAADGAAQDDDQLLSKFAHAVGFEPAPNWRMLGTVSRFFRYEDLIKATRILLAERAAVSPATAWKAPKQHCQNGGDVCLAGNRDGICCPEDSCDIDDGTRKNPATVDERAAFASQQIYDRFSFLEGVVNEHNYRKIADTAVEIARASQAAAPAEAREPSPTAGMTLAERIKHVGGRENAATYIEFGSVAAVDALIKQVIRDLPRRAPADAGEAVDALFITDQDRKDLRTAVSVAADLGQLSDDRAVNLRGLLAGDAAAVAYVDEYNSRNEREISTLPAIKENLNVETGNSGEAVAYLVTGGRMFKDKPFLRKEAAEQSVRERNDGASIKPLGVIAARAQGAQSEGGDRG